MKKVLSVALSGAMLCTILGGCSSGTKQAETTQAASEAVSEAAQEGEGGETEAAEGEAVELEMLLHKVEITDIMNTMVEDFHEDYPNITITVNCPSDHKTVLQSRAVANEMPDFVTFPYDNDYLIYATDGFFEDLTNEEFMKQNISEDVYLDNQLDGKSYFLPVLSNACGVFYNVDMFEENGIEIPTTMDEFFEVCETFKAKGITALSCSDQETWTLSALGDRLTGLIFDDKGELFQGIADGTASAADSEGMRKVGEIFLKMRDYAQPDSLGVGYEQAINEFANGETAMMYQGTWLLPLVLKANPDMNVSVFPLPGETEEQTRVGINMDLGIAVSVDSEHKEAAKTFLEWLSTTENAQKLADMEGSPSLIKGVEAATPQFESLVALIDEGKSFRISRNYWKSGMVSEINNVFQRLLVSKDVDEFLEDLDNSVKMIYNQ